jgi:hypothetical protein
MSTHTELVEDAVHVLREMPRSMQATAARAIIDYATGDDDFVLSDEQVAEVESRVPHPDRNFLSLDDVRHRLRHFGARD